MCPLGDRFWAGRGTASPRAIPTSCTTPTPVFRRALMEAITAPHWDQSAATRQPGVPGSW